MLDPKLSMQQMLLNPQPTNRLNVQLEIGVSLSFFVNAYRSLASWRATVGRLAGFQRDSLRRDATRCSFSRTISVARRLLSARMASRPRPSIGPENEANPAKRARLCGDEGVLRRRDRGREMTAKT